MSSVLYEHSYREPFTSPYHALVVFLDPVDELRELDHGLNGSEEYALSSWRWPPPRRRR